MGNVAEAGIRNNQIKSKEKIRSLFGWFRFGIVIILMYFIFHFAIGIELINGHSMNPTIEDKSMLLVNKIFFTPGRGDIVVVRDPHGYNIIKRIIGMPNDAVLIKSGVVFVNGKALSGENTKGKSIDVPVVTVPKGEIFVMGDNRTPGESLDSRDPSVGTFSIQSILGKAIFSIWPLRKL